MLDYCLHKVDKWTCVLFKQWWTHKNKRLPEIVLHKSIELKAWAICGVDIHHDERGQRRKRRDSLQVLAGTTDHKYANNFISITVTNNCTVRGTVLSRRSYSSISPRGVPHVRQSDRGEGNDFYFINTCQQHRFGVVGATLCRKCPWNTFTPPPLHLNVSAYFMTFRPRAKPRSRSFETFMRTDSDFNSPWRTCNVLRAQLNWKRLLQGEGMCSDASGSSSQCITVHHSARYQISGVRYNDVCYAVKPD